LLTRKLGDEQAVATMACMDENPYRAPQSEHFEPRPIGRRLSLDGTDGRQKYYVKYWMFFGIWGWMLLVPVFRILGLAACTVIAVCWLVERWWVRTRH
jgi:hypothetical protein